MSASLRIQKVHRPFQVSRAVEKEMERYLERINDPQDLEDGLLAVAFDQLRDRMAAEMARAAETQMVTFLCNVNGSVQEVSLPIQVIQ